MLSSDKYARHKLLGETDLKLGDIELRHPIRIWMNLRDMDEVSCPGRHRLPIHASLELFCTSKKVAMLQDCTEFILFFM